MAVDREKSVCLLAPVRSLFADCTASTTLVFGLVFPVLVLAVGVAVDYSIAGSQKSQLQNVADAAALAAARELAVGATASQLRSVAEAIAQSKLADSAAKTPFTVTANAVDDTGVEV